MRTTLTLEDDLAHELREQARHTGRSFKAVVNDTLRRGLGVGDKPNKTAAFVVEAKPAGFRTGIDIMRLNQLYDELEVDDTGGELLREVGG